MLVAATRFLLVDVLRSGELERDGGGEQHEQNSFDGRIQMRRLERMRHHDDDGLVKNIHQEYRGGRQPVRGSLNAATRLGSAGLEARRAAIMRSSKDDRSSCQPARIVCARGFGAAGLHL